MPIDSGRMRTRVEKLIDENCDNKSESLRLTYADERSEKELMLFIKKGYKFGLMQMWILEGICETKDYCEEMERDGSLKKWLEVEIE